jgi:hypothetical protein
MQSGKYSYRMYSFVRNEASSAEEIRAHGLNV